MHDPLTIVLIAGLPSWHVIEVVHLSLAQNDILRLMGVYRFPYRWKKGTSAS